VINTYDIDGVINMGEGLIGLHPRPEDMIITGRSLFDEHDYTWEWFKKNDISNRTFFNPVRFEEKTRKSSGEHKAKTLNMLLDAGYEIGLHFEDDDIQALIIEQNCPRVKVVRIVHNLVEKENVWHGDKALAPSRKQK
jgi:hypothetical protein